MIELHTGPVTGGGVAAVALRGGLDVISGFAGGGHPIVARRTGTADDAVIEPDAVPTAGRGMTGVALCGGRDMTHRFTGGIDTVVTT